MITALKIKLDPTPTHKHLIDSHIGAARYAYNVGLAKAKDAYAKGEKFDLSHYGLRAWWNQNKNDLAPWWKENSKEAYSNSLRSLSRAFDNFFKKRAGFPRFKKKSSRGSYTITTGSFGVADPYGVKIPRIGRVHTLEKIEIDGRVISMTVSKNALGYFASLSIEQDVTPAPQREEKTVGVDLGVETLATLSTGEKIANPRFERSRARKRRRLAQALSRKRKGSKNRAKARERLARHEARTAQKRAAYIHEITTRLTREYTSIAIEDLAVSNMLRNHHLARSLSDASFFEFRRQLAYKCERSGTSLVVVDRFYPSTKTCSNCGAVKATLPLRSRTFSCECGLVIDRDINAAINLDRFNVAGSAPETQNACGEDVRHAQRADLAEAGIMHQTLVCVRHEAPSGNGRVLSRGATQCNTGK